VELGLLLIICLALILGLVHVFFSKPELFKDLIASGRNALSIIPMAYIVLFSYLIILIPWELWLYLPKVPRHLKVLWSRPALVFYLYMTVVVFVGTYFHEVVDKVTEVLRYIFAIIVIILLVFFFLHLGKRVSDRMRLWRLDIADRVDRPWVYQICRSLRTSAERQRFLEILRLRNVELTDEPGSRLLNDSWIDSRVQESLAKLESLWQGLEE
jgi:hypothetical protein